MGNIANKDDFIYKILFKRTMLFPTLYLGISIIVCFIILSSICTSLNYNYLATTLLIGTLLIILFIFFLGRMFKFLGVFLRPHTIRQYVQRELHKEIEKASRSNLK